MFVFYQISVTVAYLNIPNVYAIGVHTHTPDVIYIAADGFLCIFSEAIMNAVSVGERRAVVYSKPCFSVAIKRLSDDIG